MPNIIQQLQKDHVNLSRLLDLLDTQIGTLHDGEMADCVLMSDAMRYMLHYPDVFHHPKEDLIFNKLKERDPSARAVVNKLIKEHKALAEKGTQFLESLERIESEEMVLRETLESQGRDYIAFLRSHMEKEEDEVFPLASKVLGDADWKEVEAAMELRNDPVFGVVEEEYQALYGLLVQQGD